MKRNEIDFARHEIAKVNRDQNIVAIVLAAGRSKRFGGDKRVHMTDSGTLLQRSLSKPIVLNLPTLLVLRPDDKDKIEELVGPHLNARNLSIAFAEEADSGMGHSLAYAFKTIASQEFDAAMVVLADMPWIQLSSFVSVITQADAGKIVIPCYKGRNGHPILFSKKWFVHLTQLSGDTGAKELLRVNRQAVVKVTVDDEGVLQDLDSPPPN